MKDRIRQLMESQHMTQQVFAQFLEMSPASLSSIFNDRTRPTLNIVEAIKKKIPNVNTDWLMFGIGDVYMSEEGSEAESAVSSEATERTIFDVSSPSEPVFDFGAPHFDSSHQRSSAGSQRPRGAESVREEVKFVERPPRKVTEIRVYYDDLTYETFVPSKK